MEKAVEQHNKELETKQCLDERAEEKNIVVLGVGVEVDSVAETPREEDKTIHVVVKT